MRALTPPTESRKADQLSFETPVDGAGRDRGEFKHERAKDAMRFSVRKDLIEKGTH